MNIINFTPVPAFLGGALIGLAVVLFFVFNGRLIGISGIASNFLTSKNNSCLLYTSPSPRDVEESRMPSSA